MNKLFENITLSVFLRSGAKLFKYVDIYSPDGNDRPPHAITFTDNKKYLDKVTKIETRRTKKNLHITKAKLEKLAQEIWKDKDLNWTDEMEGLDLNPQLIWQKLYIRVKLWWYDKRYT